MFKFERTLYLTWTITCLILFFSTSGVDLRATINSSGFDIMETVNERSLVRTVVSPARELGGVVAVRETLKGLKIYELEDGKYLIHFALSKPVSYVFVSDGNSLKVSHAGNIYSDWHNFTDQREVVAVIIQSSAEQESKLVVKLREPELLENGRTLEFFANPCTPAEAVAFSKFLNISRLKQLDLMNSEVLASEIWFMP